MNHAQREPIWLTAHAEDLPEDHLQAVLEFYEENLVLRTFQDGTTTVKHLSPQQVAQALSGEVSLSTGLLTPDVLWWRHDPNGATTAVWREPQVWPTALQVDPFQPTRRFNLPMPGLVFVTAPGTTPSVFAAKKRPTDPSESLYNMPAFNVFANGRVCPGNHHFPQEPQKIPESFFQSFFTVTGDPQNRSKKHGSDILSLWEQINGKAKYPLKDLVEHSTVAAALERAGR